MDSAAILETRFGGICPTSIGERIDHVSATRIPSTTWMATLSTKVFSATWIGLLDSNEVCKKYKGLPYSTLACCPGALNTQKSPYPFQTVLKVILPIHGYFEKDYSKAKWCLCRSAERLGFSSQVPLPVVLV